MKGGLAQFYSNYRLQRHHEALYDSKLMTLFNPCPFASEFMLYNEIQSPSCLVYSSISTYHEVGSM